MTSFLTLVVRGTDGHTRVTHMPTDMLKTDLLRVDVLRNETGAIDAMFNRIAACNESASIEHISFAPSGCGIVVLDFQRRTIREMLAYFSLEKPCDDSLVVPLITKKSHPSAVNLKDHVNAGWVSKITVCFNPKAENEAQKRGLCQKRAPDSVNEFELRPSDFRKLHKFARDVLASPFQKRGETFEEWVKGNEGRVRNPCFWANVHTDFGGLAFKCYTADAAFMPERFGYLAMMRDLKNLGFEIAKQDLAAWRSWERCPASI